MSRVFWDTNLFVYLFEDFGDLSARVVDLRKRMLARGDELVTSALTLGELLVRPVAAGDEELAARYAAALEQAARIVAFDAVAARHFARIRADRTVRPPDAIQLACAAVAGADLFLTNDDRLSTKTVPGVQFIVSLGRSPL